MVMLQKGIVGYNPIISGQLTREEINLSSKDPNRPLNLKTNDIEIKNNEKKSKNIFHYLNDRINLTLHYG